MFIHVILVHVVEMAIVQIVHMTVMANRSVSAVRGMLVSVVGVVFLGTCGHWCRSFANARLPIDAPLDGFEESVRAGLFPTRPGMNVRRLQTRFLLAGCLLVATTLLVGLWSAWTFARLSAAADHALRDSQAKIDLTAELTGSLEREDDALLLALSGDVERARRELTAEQRRGESCYQRMLERLGDEDRSALTIVDLI